MKKINPMDLVSFGSFAETYAIRVDPVYAKADHPENAFGQVYHTQSQIWGHRDLVKTILLASRRLHQAHGWVMTIKDCLRPIEAQALMVEMPIVKANPHWVQEPRFLSGPGQGGHPRGMAVDVVVDGIDFGTGFDHFVASTDKDLNPAHRQHPQSSAEVQANRRFLEEAIMTAAKDFNLPMLPLPQEWWDFRFPASYTNEFAPLSDGDLLPHQKMMQAPQEIPLEPDAKILKELKEMI